MWQAAVWGALGYFGQRGTAKSSKAAAKQTSASVPGKDSKAGSAASVGRRGSCCSTGLTAEAHTSHQPGPKSLGGSGGSRHISLHRGEVKTPRLLLPSHVGDSQLISNQPIGGLPKLDLGEKKVPSTFA